uniref:Uncharacterized protein n=1 Tax=Ditylenchus dipsaci TaxID=166011 RepID=A0A915D3C6_9BILA
MLHPYHLFLTSPHVIMAFAQKFIHIAAKLSSNCTTAQASTTKNSCFRGTAGKYSAPTPPQLYPPLINYSNDPATSTLFHWHNYWQQQQQQQAVAVGNQQQQDSYYSNNYPAAPAQPYISTSIEASCPSKNVPSKSSSLSQSNIHSFQPLHSKPKTRRRASTASLVPNMEVMVEHHQRQRPASLQHQHPNSMLPPQTPISAPVCGFNGRTIKFESSTPTNLEDINHNFQPPASALCSETTKWTSNNHKAPF